MPRAINVFSHLKDLLTQIMCGTYPDPSDPHRVLSLRYPPRGIQERLRRLSSAYLMTTNYDQVLEACLGVQDVRIVGTPKYLFQHTGIVVGTPSVGTAGTRLSAVTIERDETVAQGEGSDDFFEPDIAACAGALVFHPHGIAADTHHQTICIGYEHYMGYVQHLRERLIRGNVDREFADKVVYLLLGLSPSRNTWEELFFTTDLAICGLGLDYEEADLWELLALRAAVLNTSGTLRGLAAAGFVPNQVVFYDTEVEDDPSALVAKGSSAFIDDRYHAGSGYLDERRAVFLDLNVDVRVAHGGVVHHEDGTTTRQYDRCLEAILDELCAKGW